MYGATILYNVLLSKHYHKTIGNEESRQWVAGHEASWANWQTMVSKLDVAAWDLSMLFGLAPLVSQSTRKFVRDWVGLVKDGNRHLSESVDAERLIRSREQHLKLCRSRFINRKALEQWNGNSGLQFNYRWHRVRQFIKDLYAGLEAK
jgi:hypothetical protein